MSDLDWLIIGGGVHGTFLSNVLVQQGASSADRVRVLDPHKEPLQAFYGCMDATGMTYLRSPSVHHLELDPYALLRFGKKGRGKKLARFVPPYGRPGVAFFREHVRHVVETRGLAHLRLRGRATTIARTAREFRVETDAGVLSSARVVLALGLGEQLCVPAWASPSPRARVKHLFEPGFSRSALESCKDVLVVGGGISAAQLATNLARKRVHVTLVARHAPRVARFDSDPAWLGPKAMETFEQAADPALRRSLIREARNRGSMPPEVAADLKRLQATGHVRWVIGSVKSVAPQQNRQLVSLHGAEDAPTTLLVDEVVLATGFEPHRPGGRMVDDLIENLSLPCAACGYPIVSRRLEWTDGLFVTGPLAELELGPIARNISGARAAGERLLAAA